MTLQFHTWDKFKQITSMTKQQITNFASLYTHLIGIGAMSLSVLKVIFYNKLEKIYQISYHYFFLNKIIFFKTECRIW